MSRKPVTEAAAAVGGVTLRAHQEEALEAIVRGLTDRPGMETPGGLRVTVQMATGTGKSYVGAAAGQHFGPHGAVLVVVPTLDLLIQMIGSWLKAGRSGDMYAVCSLTPGELPSGVRGSTNGVQIALWLARAAQRRRPVTLFATYASVGAVADAYAVDASLVGEVPPLELMVCDEAHRSSGWVEKSWTIVHEQAEIPCLRRLYMTATPRIWAPPKVAGRPGARQPLSEETVVSMSDTRIYGPQVFTLGLAQAIDHKLMAPFEVVVLELRDPAGSPDLAEKQPVPWGPGVGEAEDGSEDQVAAPRVAAIQAGLIRCMAERGLRKCITFHNRTIEARYFAETLNQTAERLNLENPEKYPEEVWAQWISGEHDANFRKRILRGFGKACDGDGLAHAVMANCRVLGEGVDLPDCDSVLLQGRGSMVDIVQAVGRALRMKPDEGKVASLIVPVFLGPGEEPGDLLGSDSYAPLAKILAALRSHDAKVVEALAVPQRSGKRTKGRSAEAVIPPGQSSVEGVASFTLPVRFQSDVDADTLALFVSMRVLSSENQYWREGITAARAWFAEHGDLEMPVSMVVPTPSGKGVFPLGRWLSDRRSDHAAGLLPEYRVDMLDELGMVWSVSEARFEASLDWARLWAKEHYGSLAAPKRASIGGFAIGAWLAGMRMAASLPEGEPGALSAQRRAALEAIDPWWCPAWPIRWQRTYTAARGWWLGAGGRVDWATLPKETEFEGEPLGRWVAEQRATWPQLEEEQRELLQALGIDQDPAAVAARAAAAAKPKVSQAERFERGLNALAQFVEREGHARVPRAHKEPLEVVQSTAGGQEETVVIQVALGVWVNNQKARRAKLSENQVAALDALGMRWT